MKIILQIVLVTSLATLAFSCSKAVSEIKVKNPTPAPSPGPNKVPPTAPPTNPVATEPVVTTTSEVALVSSELLPTKFGTQVVLNKMERKQLKGIAKLQKKFTYKPNKKTSLNFKGWENIGRSQCDSTTGQPEVTALVKIGDKETSAKYGDLLLTEVNPNQELSLTISIDNSFNCEMLLFEFAVVATEISDVVIEPEPNLPITAGLITVEVQEFLSIGTFGPCVDLACLTRDLKTFNKKFENPKNKMEQISEDQFVLSPSVQIICQNRHSVLDTSGITNSTCKLVVNPALTLPEIKIYRGEGKKANVLGVEITTPILLEKLCNKWPNINSDEKVEIFVSETEKKEVPRLELTCNYDKNSKVISASFIGVIN